MSNLNKDKQGKYIRYVIDNIVDSSDVINVAYISVPWIDTKWNNGVNDIPHTWIQKDYPRALYYNFVDYVRNIYGIESSYNSDNMSWLFNEVLFKLRVKISEYKRSRLRRGLNESKQERFQQFIYDDFINNFTRIRGKGRYSRLMFIEPIDNEAYVMWSVGDVSSSGKLRQFEPDEEYTDWFLDNEVVKLFKDRYGIEDVDKIHDMWLGILDRLYIKMTENTFNDNTLNESMNKEHKLIKVIVDDFLSRHLRLSNDPQDINDGYDTALDFDTDLWNFDYTDLIDFWLDDDIINSNRFFDKEFIKKIGYYYGITKKEEIQYIYREIVLEMIKRTKEFLIKHDRFVDDWGNPINESMNKEEKFRNFIIDDFVEKMDIRDGHATMWFDDNQFRRDFNGYKRHYNPYEGIKNDIESGYRFEFDRYMRNLYGITNWKTITMLWYNVSSLAASRISQTLR